MGAEARDILTESNFFTRSLGKTHPFPIKSYMTNSFFFRH